VLSWASDQYALACVTYEMLTGAPPVVHDSVSVAREKTRRAEFRSLEEVHPELPPTLSTAVKRALAADPEDRFASVGEFADALAAATGHTERPGSKRRWLRWTGTAAMAVVIVLAWYLGASRSASSGTDGGEDLNPDLVAVLPFPVQGSQELAIWKGGMARLLAYALDGAGELSIVDPRAILGSFEREPPPGPLDPEIGREIAARFGAGSFILGDVLEAEDGSASRRRSMAQLASRRRPLTRQWPRKPRSSPTWPTTWLAS
jgi:serine/threonine protein kinase